MKRICIVTTMSSSIDNWIKPFLPYYRREGIDVSVACNMTEEYRAAFCAEFPGVHAYPIAMPRGADLIGTAKAIPALKKLFQSEKFDMIQYSTPNASFYSAIAGKWARIPVRLYCQWGMVFVSCSGLKRKIFEWIERTTCRLSTNVQPDSHGNLQFCRENGFYDEKKSEVIWNGSAKGVDLSKFDMEKKIQWRQEIRAQYHLDDTAVVLGFVGRLGRDKGCNELFAAFRKLSEKHPELRLLFVGPIEKEQTIEELDYFYSEDKIVKTDRVPDVWRYYAAMDLFILPSYREGFGMSVVEAQALGVPVIVTDIPGPTNGMLRDQTGLCIPVRNAQAIEAAVETLLADPERRSAFGERGIDFVRNGFDSKIFAEKLMENRKKLLGMEDKHA